MREHSQRKIGERAKMDALLGDSKPPPMAGAIKFRIRYRESFMRNGPCESKIVTADSEELAVEHIKLQFGDKTRIVSVEEMTT